MEILLVFTKAKFKNGRIRIMNGTNPITFNKNKYSKAGYHHTDASMMIFDFSENNTKSWEVFQGFITYEPGSTKLCPLANKDQPFKIFNEAESLYIRSSYKKDALLYEKKCSWKFEAPKNHSFKIKIQQLESEVLIISGSERKLIKSRGTYHFNNTAILISHTTTLNKNHTFEAKISVVNLTKIHKSDDCIFIEKIKENTAIWTTEENNFDNKIRCRRNVTVISGHQLYANITIFDLEQGVDALRYYDNDTELLHPIEILENDAYVFLPFSENENRSITFEFTSDESIIYKNFSIEFSSVDPNP
uniref:CUB domain-containing protein n=1 Tax=Panagrolaimus davidi TaxID=227884 RepID=A0A914QEF3_9BILA